MAYEDKVYLFGGTKDNQERDGDKLSSVEIVTWQVLPGRKGVLSNVTMSTTLTTAGVAAAVFRGVDEARTSGVVVDDASLTVL